MTENSVELKKLKCMNQLKNKLQLVYQKLDYRLLKESWPIIAITGPSVASKKDQNNKELDIIWENKSKGNNVPTKILFEKSVLGKSKSPNNKPIITDIIKSLSFKFSL